MRGLLLLSSLMGLMACVATNPLDTSQVDFSLTPDRVVGNIDKSRGKTALWGGMILSTKNLKQSTRIQVLAFPMDSFSTPQTDKKPLGRFIIEYPRYLESATYAKGRKLSVVGSVSGIQSGKVDQAVYQYPVIKSQQLHLWPKSSDQPKTSVHFGIGIGIKR